MEAFDQHYDNGGPSVPTISLVGPTPTKRKRKSTTDTATPAAGRVSSDPPAPAKSKSSSKKRKSKGADAIVEPPTVLAPSNPPATLAEIPLTLSSPPAPPAQPVASTSNASASLAFSAMALAQAKRHSDMKKKKEKRSKSSSGDDDSNDAPKETEKETKELRKKRKEEKKRRKEEKKSKAGEGEEEADKETKKDRKRKSRDKDGAEGKEGKKSKKHKKSTSKEDGTESPPQAAESEPSVATNFTNVVSSFMAHSAAASSSAVPAAPAKEKQQNKEVGAEQPPPTPLGQKPTATTPSSKKSKKEKKKGKETPALQPQQPFPSHLPSSSSPIQDRDPMDAPSSPVPEGDPMDASSSPVSSPDRSTRPRIVLSETPIDPVLTAKTPPQAPGGHSAAGIAAAKSNRSAVAAAKAAPKKTAAAASKDKKKKEDAFDEAEDEALRERLKDETARHEFLASKWVDIPILLRLEKKGIVTWKRGKYTESERAAVRSCLDTFCKTHGLNDQELIDIIFAKGRGTNARSKYPGFWADVAQVVPGRPLRYVKEAVQRMYHPNAHKGAWTKEEDETLQRAYTETPGAWVKIGEAVGRPYTDCRDRYTKQIMADDRVIGRWTKDEERQLTEAVKKTAEELGKDMFDGDLPWPTVQQYMGGKRSVHQCRVKWQEFMVPLLTGDGYMPASASVLEAMRKFGYEHEKDVVWRDVSKYAKSHSKGAQAAWRRMLSFVTPVDGKSFKEILDLIESKMDEIEAGDSARAAATVARVARNAASAERKAKREASALKVPSERTWSRSLSGGSRGGSEQPSWLEAAGLRVEAAEAWMDNLVASRSASTAVDLGVESFLEPVESPGESPPAPASAVAGSSEKGKDKPRSRKVSFADDAAAAE